MNVLLTADNYCPLLYVTGHNNVVVPMYLYKRHKKIVYIT